MRSRQLLGGMVLTLWLGSNVAMGQAGQGGAFDDKAFDAAIQNATANSSKVAKLLNIPDISAFNVLMSVGHLFVYKDGKFNKDANEKAFGAAIDNITPAKIKKAQQLAGFPKEQPPFYAFIILLGASGGFVSEGGGFNSSGFDAALDNIVPGMLTKARGRFKELRSREGKPFLLFAVLWISADYLDEQGKFKAKPFNSELDTVLSTRRAEILRQMQKLSSALEDMKR